MKAFVGDVEAGLRNQRALVIGRSKAECLRLLEPFGVTAHYFRTYWRLAWDSERCQPMAKGVWIKETKKKNRPTRAMKEMREALTDPGMRDAGMILVDPDNIKEVLAWIEEA